MWHNASDGTVHPMTDLLSRDDISDLWETFQDVATGDVITFDGLRRVMQSLGHDPSDAELHALFHAADIETDSLTFEQFLAIATALHGDQDSRLHLAFEIFDHDVDGYVVEADLAEILAKFGLTEDELKQLFQEGDLDGDERLDFVEFASLMPTTHHPDRYQASPITFASSVPQVTSSEPARPDQRPLAIDHGHGQGTSRLQLQIGLFRLLQGAAYRSFRENYAANNETHLRAKKLPYTFPHFVGLVNQAVALYKAMGVVEPACFPVLDALVDSVNAEYARFETRMAHWADTAKTEAMQIAAQQIDAKGTTLDHLRHKFAAGIEFALTLSKRQLSLLDVVDDMLAVHELNRLRRQELHQELHPTPPPHSDNPRAYLDTWQVVIVEAADEVIPGAIVPTAYWYTDFMPKLLAACSVATATDLEANLKPDAAALDAWYAATLPEFTPYALDIAEHFPSCSPAEKLMLKQAWRLTRHYLNGVQKRRERLEFGRESGYLSQYVAFIDVFVGRNDIEAAQMRLSFPYYIGPAVWRFFHTLAEITCSASDATVIVSLFKDFFKLFATMYPCPYCRYHLNAYVVQNREVDMYPIEYIILGGDPNHRDFQMSIDDKLACVTDGISLRLFFWKLHNTVSSSIARSEAWYHPERQAFYTTRYWPSLDAELARSRILGHLEIPLARIERLYGLLKPEARLATLRDELQLMIAEGNDTEIGSICEAARAVIAELEAALLGGDFLQTTYSFDPNLDESAPHFTPDEEAFSRSGIFVEAV